MPPSMDVCRLCAQQKKIKSDIFSEKNNILHKITSVLPLNITSEDQLPKRICIECQGIVEQFYGYKLKVLRADVKLNKIASVQTPQKSNKAIVKKELDEVDTVLHLPALEHNYFETAPSTINVKLERNDDVVERSHNIDDTVQVILDEIALSTSHIDSKTSITEVLLESDLQNPIHQEESDTFVNYETKPYLEIALDEFELGAETSATIELIEDNGIIDEVNVKPLEFSDADLMLKDGEVCNIDEEAIEAEIMKKKDPNSRLLCGMCSKSFKFLAALRKHRKIHDDSDIIYSCNYCVEAQLADFQFASHKSLKSHIYNKHLKMNEYYCKKCPMGFRTKFEYKSHVKSIHFTGFFKCSTCSKKFKTKSTLKTHMKVHLETKKYVCDICGNRFLWPSSLKYHLDAHSNVKNFLCSECGKKFSSKVGLQEHMNTHTGAKPLCCQICHQNFSHLSTLKKHEALHRPQPYHCLTCGQGFRQPFLLKQHETVHTESRPFKCTVCSMTFRTQSNLCTHTKIHGEKRYKCNECDLKFTRGQQLRDHMVRHTGRKHICPAPECGKAYSQRYPLTKHFRKQHSNLALISKRGGRNKPNIKNELPPTEGIKYAYRFKEEIPIICIS